MLDILSLVIPFFAVISCGYFGAKLVGEAGQQGINNLVLYFALPTLLFSLMARSDLAERFEPDFVAAYTSVSLVLFTAAFIFVKLTYRLGRQEAAIYAMGSVYGNTGYMGIPIIVIMLGHAASIPVVITLIIDLAVMVPLVSAIVESGSRSSGKNPLHGAFIALFATIRNPLIIAAGLGAAWSITGPGIPPVLDGFLELLGSAAAPCALFALGSSLYGKPLGHAISPALFISFLKLIVHPIAIWIAMMLIWKIDPSWVHPALIAASLPVAVTVYVVARQYQTLVIGTSTTILFSTTLSLVSVPLIMLAIERGLIF